MLGCAVYKDGDPPECGLRSTVLLSELLSNFFDILVTTVPVYDLAFLYECNGRIATHIARNIPQPQSWWDNTLPRL